MSNKWNGLIRNKQIFVGAILSYAAIAFNILSGLLYTPWMIRTIGDDQYALYTLALSIVNLFLLDFGIGSAVSKFLAAYYAEERYDEANRFMGIVYKIFLAISAVITVCLVVFYFLTDVIYQKLTPEELEVFKRLFIIVGVYSVLSFPFSTFNSILMADEKFIAIKACNLISKVLSVALIVVCLLFDRGVYALVLVHAVINLAVVGVKYIIIRRSTKHRADMTAWDPPMAKKLFGYAAWVTVRDVAQRCIFAVMPTVIAAIIGSAEVTLFSLAATLESYVYTFSDAINGMFLPKISRLLLSKDATEDLTRLMIRVGKFHVFTIGLIFVGFACVGQDFVAAWMGEGYEPVYVSALLLIFPSLIDTPQQVAKTTLLAKNIVKEQAVVYIGMAVTNLLLAGVLLPFVGVVGASVAVCVAYLIRTLGLNILYRRKLSLNLPRFFVSVYGRWIPVALLTFLGGYYLSRLIPLNGWLGAEVKACAVAGIYAVLYALICIGPKQLKQMAGKIFAK